MRNIIQIILCALAFNVLTGGALAEDKPIPPLTATERNYLLTTPFKVSTSTKSIPPAVQQLLIGSKGLDMAEPGQPFQVSCVVDMSKPLPAKRLIFIAMSNDQCLVAFERGGIAHMYLLNVYTLKDGKAELIAAPNFRREIKSFEEMQDALRHNQAM